MDNPARSSSCWPANIRAHQRLARGPTLARDGRTTGLIQLADKYEGDFTVTDDDNLTQLARLAIENAAHHQELNSNDARKNQWLAMLAREMRNPLGPSTAETCSLR